VAHQWEHHRRMRPLLIQSFLYLFFFIFIIINCFCCCCCCCCCCSSSSSSSSSSCIDRLLCRLMLWNTTEEWIIWKSLPMLREEKIASLRISFIFDRSWLRMNVWLVFS
jgi:hypothetical protein